MALFFTHHVLLANEHLKNQWIFCLCYFLFAFYILALWPHVYIPWFTRDSDVCHHALHIYIFVCVWLEREGSLSICTSSVLCSWLVFVNWFTFFHANWRQNITAALKLVHFIHFSLCNHMFLLSHWLYGNLSSVSLWPYFFFFFFLCINNVLLNFRRRVLLLWRMWHKIVHLNFLRIFFFFFSPVIVKYEPMSFYFFLFISFIQRMFLSLKKKKERTQFKKKKKRISRMCVKHCCTVFFCKCNLSWLIHPAPHPHYNFFFFFGFPLYIAVGVKIVF